MTELPTGPGMAADVLVWSIVLALSVTMLAAAAWFVVMVWRWIRQ
jgi:hypothetical protein